MLWLFLILAASVGAVLWAGLAAYLRVHRHMKATAKTDAMEHESDIMTTSSPDAGKEQA